MPRQTSGNTFRFPDGFRMEIQGPAPAATYEDVGILEGGGEVTVNWDDWELDAGNYEQLFTYAHNFTVAVAPTNLWNFDDDALEAVFEGVLARSTASYPSAGEQFDLETEEQDTRRISLPRVNIRLRHYDVDATEGSETDADIDWEMNIYNCKIDAGFTFNLGGVNDDTLDSVSVSFTGKPDPSEGFRVLSYFQRS